MPSGPTPRGPRLWLEPARVRPDGSLAPARWCIRDDGRYKHRTGFGAEERRGAEEELRDYIATKHQIAPGNLDPGNRLTIDILKLYADEVAPQHARPAESASRLKRMMLWWGQSAMAMRNLRDLGTSQRMTGHLTDISPVTCRAYVAHVGKRRSASMDLEMLRAAQNYAVKQEKLSRPVAVTLPEPSLPRERWLTRIEVARLVWAAWRHRRTNGKTGEKDEFASRKHVARFIVAAHYSGTRKTAILLAAFVRTPGHGYIDLDEGVWYRQPSGRRRTNKRQPPVPIPAPLLAHMRRWRKNGQTFLIEYQGEPVERLDKAFRSLIAEQRMGDDVVIHTLRHTAITWGLQRGMEPWDATGYFGLSLDVLMKTYGHHCPTHLRDAAEKMARPRPVLPNRVANRVAE